MATTAGFWCYARDDNDLDDGRILRLADRLKAQFSLQTATELELFVDRDVKWGEAWRERIEKELSNVTFLIPVVTPRFFQREECRKELRRFWTYANRLGITEHLLPILYVNVPELEDENPTDELVALIKGRQWEDWTELRLSDEVSPEHRRGVSELAARLADIASGPPPGPPPAPPSGGPSSEGPPKGGANGAVDTTDQEEPGWLDLLKRGEDAFPRWQSTVERLTPAMERMTSAVEASSAKAQRPDIQQRGYAGMLRVMRQLAQDLAEPAAEILELGQSYGSQLLELDPAIQTLLRFAEEDPDVYGESDAREFFSGVMQMEAAASEAVRTLQGLAKEIDGAAKMSMDLRPPLRDINRGLRNIIDGQSVVEDWGRRARALDQREEARGESD